MSVRYRANIGTMISILEEEFARRYEFDLERRRWHSNSNGPERECAAALLTVASDH
jgi:hypothetical protein